MKKDFDRIQAQLGELTKEVADLKKAVYAQKELIDSLKKQLASVTTATIETKGKKTTASYGNLILDELLALKKKLEGFSAESLRSMINDVAELKNKVEGEVDESREFSLSELKNELLKLADMMSV